jgi:hypothetical protein
MLCILIAIILFGSGDDNGQSVGRLPSLRSSLLLSFALFLLCLIHLSACLFADSLLSLIVATFFCLLFRFRCCGDHYWSDLPTVSAHLALLPRLPKTRRLFWLVRAFISFLDLAVGSFRGSTLVVCRRLWLFEISILAQFDGLAESQTSRSSMSNRLIHHCG